MGKVAYLKVAGTGTYKFDLPRGMGVSGLEKEIARLAKKNGFLRLQHSAGILASAITHYRIESK